jgi:6-phosphogluconolactonase
VLPGASGFPIFRFDKFLQELRMLKKAAALFLVCASMAMWVSCGSTSSRYLYAAIPASNQIVVYREDPNSGILTQLAGSPISAGSAVESIVIHPSKKFLFAANAGEGDVSLFTIAATGALNEVTPRTPVGTSPTVLAMDSAGSFLYVGNSGSLNISVFAINAKSNPPTLTPVTVPPGSPGFPGSPFSIGMSPINMKVSPSGGFLYVTGTGTPGLIEAFSLNQGVPSVVSGTPFVTGNGPYGLTISSSGGFLYTGNKLDNSISEFTINADGSLTQFSNSPIGEQYAGPISLLIDKSGKYMYVANQGSSNLAAFSIGSDGALTLLTNSPFGTGAQPSVLAIDPGGKYLFVGNQTSPAVHSFSLDTGNGTLTSVSTYTLPGAPTSIAVTP